MRFTLIMVFASIVFSTGCYVKKPIEKVTFPEDAALTQEENLYKQLGTLKQNEELLVILKSGAELTLRHKYITPDTLVLAQNISKNAPRTKIPLSDIQDVKVIKVNTPLVISMGTVSGLLFLLMLTSFVEGLSNIF